MSLRLALLFSVLLVNGNALATGWRPSPQLLKAVRIIESSDGQFLYGDKGQSLGDYQLSEAAWIDVTFWRKARGLRVYDYDRYVLDSRINKAYAADYLAMLYGELLRKLKRPPSASELYAAYNMGLGSFEECGFKLSRVNPVTARKAKEVAALAKQKPQTTRRN